MNEGMKTVTEDTHEQFMKEGESDKHAKRGVKLIRKGKYDEAIEELVKASKKHPDNWYVWYHLGMVYRHVILMDEALDAFQQAATLENVSEIHKGAAQIRAMMVSLFLDNPGDALDYADMLMKHREYEYAIRAIDIALRKIPELDQVRKVGGLDEFMRTKGPMESGVLQHKAFCLTELGRIDEARGVYENIIQIDPEAHFAYIALSAILFDQGQKDEAYGHLEKGVELKPDDEKGWFFYGDLLIKDRRYDEAIEKLRRGLEIHSGNAFAVYNIARASEALGRRKQSLEALALAFSLDSSYKQRALADDEFQHLHHDSDFLNLMRS